MVERFDAKIDVPVLMIFFCRYEQLAQVFEQVKKARPSKLYLYQDGAREGREDDVIGISKCRDIVSDENIDWDCEVHRLYQEKNFGCDPSCFMAHKWFFETEMQGIVLEDDVVPNQSFFHFCKDLLEKYKDDERVNMICGMNNTGVSKHIKESYLFTKKGSIWGWASWKRVIDTWDGEYKWLDDEKSRELIKAQMKPAEYDSFYKISLARRASGKAYHEYVNGAAMYLYERYNIVPKYNMISNVGIAKESTHSVDDIRLLPKRVQKLFYMKTYDIEFPLIHPSEIKRDYKFERKMTPTKLSLFFSRIEGVLRAFRYRGFKGIKEKIDRRRKK